MKKSINPKSFDADCIIIGAGIFGLYAARLLSKKGKKVIVVEKSLRAFSRASSINQARVHNGYHYPRSFDTAKKVAYYYNQFTKDFSFAINNSFKQIYSIASAGSKTTTKEFIYFCDWVNISLQEIDPSIYFNKGSVESAFITDEYSFDFAKIRDFLINESKPGAKIIYDTQIQTIQKDQQDYSVHLTNGTTYSAPLVINATYSGINEVIEKFKQESFDIKYEICEVAFCKVSKNLKNIGLTVMDGDFFSVMPFGNNEYHSLTSVKHTPHVVSSKNFSDFFKMKPNQSICLMHKTKNCIICAQNLSSSWFNMRSLSKKYLKPKFALEYLYSQYEIKAILLESERDDSRPTIIKQHTTNPTFLSVLSGKLSTIYDLDNYFRQLESADNQLKDQVGRNKIFLKETLGL